MAPAVRVSSDLRCAARNLSDGRADPAPRHARHFGFGILTRRAPGKHDASEGFNVVPEKIVSRIKLWSAFVGGPLMPTGCAIVAVIVAAILAAAMLYACWGRDGLDRVLRVGWWF